MKNKSKRLSNVAVFGASGRMGQEISELLKHSPTLAPKVGYVRSGMATNFKKVVKNLKPNDFSDIDVLIDFSSPQSFSANLKFAMKQGIPLVSGVTGISTAQRKELRQAGSQIPVLWSANMSLGVAILSEALRSFRGISHFDFQIEEIHHSKKVDRPSGTAIQLQQVLESVVDKKCPDPISIRGGGVFGIHKIFALSESEMISFEHTALNRKVFAEGAVRAAEWILKKEPGLYEMKDLFSL